MINKCTQFNEIIAQIKSDLKHVPSWQALAAYLAENGNSDMVATLQANLNAGHDDKHQSVTPTIIEDFADYSRISFTLTYGVVTGVRLKFNYALDDGVDVLLLELLVQHPDAFLLTELCMEGMRKTIDLSFLQSFDSLVALSLQGMNFCNVSSLTHLRRLDITFCMYHEGGRVLCEELSHLNNLQRLEIGLPRSWVLEITDALSKLSNLKVLRLVKVGLKDLTPIKSMVNLEVLDLSTNSIRVLSGIEQLTHLKQLFISGNEIECILPLTGLKQLKYLLINNNQISDLAALSNLSQLKILSLSSNQVTSLAPLSQLQQLKALILEQNKVSSVESLANLPQLEYLMLDENEIDSLEPLVACPRIRLIGALFNPVTRVSQALLDRVPIVRLGEHSESFFHTIREPDMELTLDAGFSSKKMAVFIEHLKKEGEFYTGHSIERQHVWMDEEDSCDE